MFAIWVMQNIQAEPPYLLCHTSMFFALLRFQNGLDTVHNSPNKTNKINEVTNDMQILTITAVSLLKLPEKFVRFDNPIHRFHFTRLFLGEKILKPEACWRAEPLHKLGGANLAGRALHLNRPEYARARPAKADCFCMYERSKMLNLWSCNIKNIIYIYCF